MKVAICVSFYLGSIPVNKAYNWKPLQNLKWNDSALYIKASHFVSRHIKTSQIDFWSNMMALIQRITM